MNLPSRDLPRALADILAGADARPVLAGETGATVLRVTLADGTDAYLKHGRGRVADDIVDESVRLRWLSGRLPCAEVLHAVAEGDAAWLLTRAIPGRTGDDWLEAEPERLSLIVDGFADFLRRLQALPVVDCPFEAGWAFRMAAARRNVAAGLVDTDDFEDDHAGWSAERIWDKLIELTPSPGARVVTHGDFSLGNLLLDDVGEVTGVIDVGRLGVADPYQDIAILWNNLREFDEAAAARLLTRLGIDQIDRQRLDFHRCLDEFF